MTQSTECSQQGTDSGNEGAMLLAAKHRIMHLKAEISQLIIKNTQKRYFQKLYRDKLVLTLLSHLLELEKFREPGNCH